MIMHKNLIKLISVSLIQKQIASKIGSYEIESDRTENTTFSAKVGGNQVKIDRVIVIDYYKLGSTGQDQDQFDRRTGLIWP